MADLAFLLQKPRPNTQDYGTTNRVSTPAQPSLSTTAAMKRLANAVRHRKYAEAEQLFHIAPGLGERQSALRFLIKMYCEQRDFTTAKAILYASFDKVGDRGVARYISHCIFGSQNAADIEEVYSRWCETHEPTPQLAQMALLGTRLLGDISAFNRAWQQTASFWEPSLKAPTLMSRVLDLLLKESWEDAGKVWRIASGMGSFEDVRPLQVFYFACRHFLVEAPNVDAVNSILNLMKQLEVSLDAQFTTLLLRYLAPMFPEMPISDWVGAAQQRGWPLGDSSVEVLIYAISKRFDSVPGFSNKLYQYGLRAMQAHGLSVKRHPLAEGSSVSRDLGLLQSCTTDGQVFDYLRSMVSRGLYIPYYHFVVAFRMLAVWKSPRLGEMVSFIQNQGYPVHCSGIDLAVVELQCRDTGYDPMVCKQLVAEYLVQYPLIGHSLSQLTQLGFILWHAGDYKTALMLVDSMRAEHSSHQKYTNANHDSASLQLALRCRLRMGYSIVSYVRGILAEQPDIYFDKEFVTSLREMLEFRSEDSSVLAEIEQHNAKLQTRCLAQIDDLIKLASTAVQELSSRTKSNAKDRARRRS